MLRFLALFAVAFSVLAPSPSRAQTTAPLHLEDFLQAVREHNPDIQAARERLQAARTKPAQASAYDDPMVSWEVWNAPEAFHISDADNNIVRLSQKLPFPGKRSAAGHMAARDADIAEQMARSVELDVMNGATKAYYDLWMTHQNILIYTRDKELIEHFAKIAETKYGVGQVSQPDVLRAQVERTRLINRVNTETISAESGAATLTAFLSDAEDSPVGVPDTPPPPSLPTPLDELLVLALKTRPELAAQDAAIAREEEGVRLAKLNYLPDFEVSGGRFINAHGGDGVGAMISLSIPIAYKYKYDAALAEADARLAAARTDRRRVEDALRRDVKQAFLRARTALEQYRLFTTTHIPQAEQALQATQMGYATGKTDFLSLIDSVRAIESVHVEHIQAAADFEKAYADLERAVGTTIPPASGKVD
jgi:outer membrane protein, heavy metal efflux system